MAKFLGSKFSNIARPYAIAAFESARENKQLENWKVFLESAAAVASDPQIVQLLMNPEFPRKKLYELFREVLSTALDPERERFLSLLVENNRLIALPAISELYNAEYAALEKISSVTLITAVAIEESFRETLKRVLTKRIQHDVTLQCEVDPAIIGGAIIHIGDKVIDASIREQLTRLLEFSLR